MRLSLDVGFRLFDDAQLERLLQKALLVLRQTPFHIQGNDEFYDYLTTFGCLVEGEYTRFPPAVIDKVMARCAEEKRKALAARQAEAGSKIAPKEVTAFTHGQALSICDLETNRLRPATVEDLTRWCHVVDELGIPARQHPSMIPTDVPLAAADFHAFATIILNSLRPHCVSVYSVRMLPFFIEACKIAKGSLEAVKAEPVFVAKAWVTSPFMLDRENIEIALAAKRQLGIPFTFGHMPVAGTSTPIGVTGALVQNTAESLAISALRLAVENLPHGITGSSAVMDMKHGFPRSFGPDLFLHGLAGMEMDDYLYRGYSGMRAHGFVGAGASLVSAQSIFEKACGYAFSAMSGARDFGVGSLAFSDVASPVQLMIDLELVELIRHMFREVSVDEEHIDLESILSTTQTGGRYLEGENTFRFFREESWLPTLLDYQAYLAWAENPFDMIAEARHRARELYARAGNRCPLAADRQKAIRSLMAEANALVRP
jgi:trimethylamine--corrinoid protein Co-methyltransferase